MSRESPRPNTAWTALAIAILVLPVLPLTLRLPRELASDHSVGDLASYEIAVLETVRGERLLGQPARFGFHQLGPAHFWAQAPLYGFSGRERFGLSLTTLLLNWTALLTMLYALLRWSESSAAAAALPLVALGFFGYYENATLFNYWPQYQNVLPFAAFVALAAATAVRRGPGWPVLLALASYLIQGYGSVLPSAAAILAAVWILRRRAGSGNQTMPYRWIWLRRGATLVVLTVFWTPPLLDELRHDPGNLGRMFRHYRSTQRAEPPSLGAATARIAPHLAGPAWHMAYGGSLNLAPAARQHRGALALAALFLAATAATAATAARDKRQWTAALCLLLLVAATTATLSSRQSDGDVFPYVFFWLSGAAALGWLVVAGFWIDRLLALGFLGRWIEARRPLVWTLAAAGLSTWLLLRPIAVPRLGDDSVGDFDRSLASHQGEGRAPIHLVSHDFAWPWALGLLAVLAKRGVPVSIANVQGTTDIPELQGLMPRWLARREGSLEVHLFDRQAEEEAGLHRLACHRVLPLDASKPVVCMYARE